MNYGYELRREQELTVAPSDIVNVASVPHRSPFRYPGGKTWLVPRVRKWLASISRPKQLIEPFAGGGIIGLSSVFDELVDTACLVELDENIAAVWSVIFGGGGKRLAEDLQNFDLNLFNVEAVLNKLHKSEYEIAFATIVKNRVSRGGIMAPGVGLMNSGENGKGLLSRWYPTTLGKRLTDIDSIRHKFEFIQGDGLEVLRENANRADVAYFIDPPYTVAGRRLYLYSAIDHTKLFEAASELKGDFLITYDNTPEIAYLAKKTGLQTRTVPMKSTHHERKLELLIGRDLRWVCD